MQRMRHMHCVGLGDNISLTVMTKVMERYSVFKTLLLRYLSGESAKAFTVSLLQIIEGGTPQ